MHEHVPFLKQSTIEFQACNNTQPGVCSRLSSKTQMLMQVLLSIRAHIGSRVHCKTAWSCIVVCVRFSRAEFSSAWPQLISQVLKPVQVALLTVRTWPVVPDVVTLAGIALAQVSGVPATDSLGCPALSNPATVVPNSVSNARASLPADIPNRLFQPGQPLPQTVYPPENARLGVHGPAHPEGVQHIAEDHPSRCISALQRSARDLTAAAASGNTTQPAWPASAQTAPILLQESQSALSTWSMAGKLAPIALQESQSAEPTWSGMHQHAPTAMQNSQYTDPTWNRLDQHAPTSLQTGQSTDPTWSGSTHHAPSSMQGSQSANLTWDGPSSHASRSTYDPQSGSRSSMRQHMLPPPRHSQDFSQATSQEHPTHEWSSLTVPDNFAAPGRAWPLQHPGSPCMPSTSRSTMSGMSRAAPLPWPALQSGAQPTQSVLSYCDEPLVSQMSLRQSQQTPSMGVGSYPMQLPEFKGKFGPARDSSSAGPSDDFWLPELPSASAIWPESDFGEEMHPEPPM